MKETATYANRPDVYGLEFIRATFISHKFARHAHDYFALGVIETGVQTFQARGAKHITPTGGVFLLNPDEPHDGEAAISTGFSYRTFYPTNDLLQHLAGDITGKNQTVPYFGPLIVQDEDVTSALIGLHTTLSQPTSTLEAQTRLYDTLALLITRYADTRHTVQTTGSERQAVRRVREYLQTHYQENPSLDELARLVALSPYYLARVFQTETGLPPHAYLESIRIRQAQQLLISGSTLSEVALEVGFADQSHFQHRFKRLLGVTPRQYLQQSKIKQDF